MATRSNRAMARLEFAVSRAAETGDMQAWMIGVQAIYQNAKKIGASASELAAMRQSLRERAELLRAQFRSRTGRLWSAQFVDGSMEELFADELSQQVVDVELVFEMIEAVKARMLLDQMSKDYRKLSDSKTRLETASLEEQMLTFEADEENDAIKSEIYLTSRLPVSRPADGGSHSALLKVIEQSYVSTECGFAGAEGVARLAEVKGALRPREALIEYFVRSYRMHPAFDLQVLIITADRTELIPVPLDDLPASGFIGSLSTDGKQPMDASPLGELVIQSRIEIQNGRDDQAHTKLQLLYEKLIRPVLEAGVLLSDFDRWIIVPHRLLHPVPWIALQDANGRHLIEEIALTFVPSASIWLKLQTPSLPYPTSFLGLANPTLPYSDLPRLPEAEQELKEIEPSLKGISTTTVVRAAATETSLRKQAIGKSIVHLATHGAFPEHDPLNFHKVLLSPTHLDDGRVNAEELREMDFHAAQLVVLSICNGGIYRFGPGDEPYGLLSALLTAGTRNVVGTLWAIEDIKGRRFMVDFYTHLLENGPAEALRRTARKLIKDGADLRDWAAFLVAGPGRPFQ